MSSKLIPSNPDDVMVIRDLTPNVVTLSVPFSRFGKLRVGGRATVVKLTSGNLAVFSPVALTPSVRKHISTLGTGQVAYIIAPDMEHHIFVSDWAQAFPGAKIIGPEGLPEKRAKVHNDPKIGHEPFAVVFKAGPTKEQTTISAEFDADFEYEYVDAHANKELVFLYKPDKVVIEADLLFNLPAKEQYSRVKDAGKEGTLSRFFSGVQSTQGEATKMKRLNWYVISKGDREGFNKSIKRIDAWDFDTIVPCHGETIVGDGKQVFRKVFEWHLQGKK
ncbi:beta-lactamase-like protein [Coniochaeta sp. 2T2.1]|nr:beta-lactamase-like protein [Coniochaeta sp. 2T2.1]